MAIKLKDVQPPMMEVELPDGSLRRYDPFSVIQKISPFLDGDQSSYSQVIQVTRDAFDLPPDVSDYQVLYLIRELVKFVEESGAVKGLMPVPQN